jgi:hypothetical protein
MRLPAQRGIFFDEVTEMERRNFWNVQIEQLRDGTVKAGLVRSGRYERYPKDTYGSDGMRETRPVENITVCLQFCKM